MKRLYLEDYSIEQNKLQTKEIQNVLDEATMAGGLEAVIPRGVYIAGTLNHISCTSENVIANDLVTFRSRDDVLTLLIHLGYLAYDQKTSLYSLLHFLMCCGILCLYESEQQKPVWCSKRRG